MTLQSIMVCGDTSMGPLSTIAGTFIMHMLTPLTVEILKTRNIDMPVFLSSNAPGGKERNEALLHREDIRELFRNKDKKLSAPDLIALTGNMHTLPGIDSQDKPVADAELWCSNAARKSPIF